MQQYDRLLKVFQEASELPPTDMESRVVIARALTRLAYTRTMLSFQKGSWQDPEPLLIAAAGADYRRSIDLFEKLLNEERGDPIIRRDSRRCAGLKGMGCYFKFTQRPKEAEQFYKRAIELRRLWSGAMVSPESLSRDCVTTCLPREMIRPFWRSRLTSWRWHKMTRAERRKPSFCAVNLRTMSLPSSHDFPGPEFMRRASVGGVDRQIRPFLPTIRGIGG